MNKETSSSYDQPDQSNQFNYPLQPQQHGQSPQLNYGQPGQSRFSFGNQPIGNQPISNQPLANQAPGSQQPYSQPNYPYNNQMNQMQNQQQDPFKNRIQLTDKQMAELRTCSRIGFWFVTLPAVAGTYFFQRYRALKTLTPASMSSIFFGSAFAYLGSKLLVAPFCFRNTYKEFQSQFNKGNFPFDESPKQPFGQFQGPAGLTGPQTPQNQLPFQQQYQKPNQLPYQRQATKNSPYLHPQFKEDNKEKFDSEEKDFTYDKENF